MAPAAAQMPCLPSQWDTPMAASTFIYFYSQRKLGVIIYDYVCWHCHVAWILQQLVLRRVKTSGVYLCFCFMGSTVSFVFLSNFKSSLWAMFGPIVFSHTVFRNQCMRSLFFGFMDGCLVVGDISPGSEAGGIYLPVAWPMLGPCLALPNPSASSSGEDISLTI